MSFHLSVDKSKALYQIQSYNNSSITINNKSIFSPFIISPFNLLEGWDVKTIIDVDNSKLKPAIALDPEIIIIGTGNKFYYPELTKISALIDKQIGYEIMDTGAACRSFTILAAECRNVVACLII